MLADEARGGCWDYLRVSTRNLESWCVNDRTRAQLTAQTQNSTLSRSRSAASTIASADAEIARFRDILRQIDELETEFDKVRHIRDIVKGFRRRVESLGGRMDGRRR